MFLITVDKQGSLLTGVTAYEMLKHLLETFIVTCMAAKRLFYPDSENIYNLLHERVQSA